MTNIRCAKQPSDEQVSLLLITSLRRVKVFTPDDARFLGMRKKMDSVITTRRYPYIR